MELQLAVYNGLFAGMRMSRRDGCASSSYRRYNGYCNATSERLHILGGRNSLCRVLAPFRRCSPCGGWSRLCVESESPKDGSDPEIDLGICILLLATSVADRGGSSNS